jgi:CheY-like chemotaxis protein
VNRANGVLPSLVEGVESGVVLIILDDDTRVEYAPILASISSPVTVCDIPSAFSLCKEGRVLPVLTCIAVSQLGGELEAELLSAIDKGCGKLLFFDSDSRTPGAVPANSHPLGESRKYPVPMWLLPNWIVINLKFEQEKSDFEKWMHKSRHDLNNIFGAILGNLHIVMDMAEEEAPYYRGLKEIKISGERGQGMVGNLHFQFCSNIKAKTDSNVEVSAPSKSQKLLSEKLPKYSPTGVAKHVLLVDDDITLLKMTCVLFAHNKIPVLSENNPLAALDRFQLEPENYSMLITDSDMDVMSGKELVIKILQIKPDLPVILCSGKEEDVLAKEARSTGIEHIILKSSPVTDLINLTKKILFT